MQNYSGGRNTFPEAYLGAVTGFKKERLAWGFCSEVTKENTPVCQEFPGVLEKAKAVGGVGGFGGVYTWRINSDNHGYENMFQVWLHNFVSGTTLPNSKDQAIVQKYWVDGGRKDGAVIPPQNLN
ncbi:hypothetical protein FGLOB1_10668 [Fusarium globosum]|uniref:Uncharacterized protein n=1 Tax=Fusarium globosum TaxID=78864 RepID=A0A8H5XWE5_9HYPO|nr:hypothetical protein FGLOB1_10668 [Fusarium globosum]